jgi:hypothetical protein
LKKTGGDIKLLSKINENEINEDDVRICDPIESPNTV